VDPAALSPGNLMEGWKQQFQLFFFRQGNFAGHNGRQLALLKTVFHYRATTGEKDRY